MKFKRTFKRPGKRTRQLKDSWADKMFGPADKDGKRKVFGFDISQGGKR